MHLLPPYVGWQPGQALHKQYGAILIDPPWSFSTWSDAGQVRGAESHYPTLTLDDLRALPLQRYMLPDCAVFMWCTWPTLPQAFDLGVAWGLTYKTCAFDWLKRTSTRQHWHVGMGYWSRANSEPCLLFTQGTPKRKSKGVQQLIVEDDAQLALFPPIIAPVMAHSTKPIEQYTRIESLVEGPYLEIFARARRSGWDAIGNGIDGRDIRDVMAA